MDLWDLTRLLLRRWYFAVPMLLVSVTAVVVTSRTVSPDYKAMGYMQLIPAPSTGKAQSPTAKQRPMNPWNDLGYAALGNAAALTVTDQTDLEKLKLEGFSDSVTVVLDERTPLFEIEAVGNSEQQATGTVREIIRLLQVDIAAKQKQYGTQSEDTISTLIINDGSSPQQDGGKIKRILIVAAGLGVLLTTALTIALDYWLLRRRSRRRTDDESSDDASTASEPVSVGKFEAIEQTRILHHQPLSRPSAHANGNVYSSERIADEHKKTEVKARAVARAVNGVKESLGPAEPEKTPGDATVVLPPSHPARRGQERRQ